MRTLDAIVQRLIDEGVGTLDVDIFAGSDVNLPDDAGPFISILESAGRPPVGVHNPDVSPLRQPSLQVTARGDVMTLTAQLIEEAYDALGGKKKISNVTIGGVFFLSLGPTSEPFSLPPDARGRVRLAFNVNATRR